MRPDLVSEKAEPRSIAVIGAGFSGTILVAHLLRRSRGGLRVFLINKSGRLARGVAYGTRSSSHVLNVPPGRMSGARLRTREKAR